MEQSKTTQLLLSSFTLWLVLLSFQQRPTLAQSDVPSSAPSSSIQTLTTESPTVDIGSTNTSFTPNDCDDITIGNFYFLLVNSLDSADEVSLFGFEDVPPYLDLYLTDNAWTGDSFDTNEGVMMFTTPPEGIPAGIAFGMGPSTTAYMYGQNWTNAQGIFSLSTGGEQVFLFCISGQQKARPIAAISYNGPFQQAGLTNYGTNESALPTSLELNGTIVLPHEDRWIYSGPKSLEVDSLKAAILDTTTNWQGSSEESSSAAPKATARWALGLVPNSPWRTTFQYASIPTAIFVTMTFAMLT